jgi:glycine betaine/proline transport system substrate-binding protein
MKSLTWRRTLCAALLTAGMSSSHAADVVIGVPNWPSVAATASILKVVLEDNFGLEVELQNGTNPVIFEAMDSGSMHVHPEVWLPNQANLHDTFVKTKGTVKMSPNGTPSFQGMCVTKATAERTGIKQLADLADPDMAKNFDRNDDGRGEVWIGASGWASTNVEKIRAKSYGYDQTLELIEMDETLAMAKLDAAVTQSQPFVFVCWTPHHMFGLHDLTVLKEPAHDPEKWVVIQPTDDADWLNKSSAPVAWADTYLHIHYAKALETDQPQAAQILSNLKVDTDQVSNMVYALTVEKQDSAEFAKMWVEENIDLVDSWL